MALSNAYLQTVLGPQFGMYMPGTYGDRWPMLVLQLKAIYRKRVAGIPWIPSNWLATVESLLGHDSQIITPLSSRGAKIGFLDTQEKRDWWDRFAADVNTAVSQYAADQQAAGAANLERLEANAVFWDRAYNIAQALAAPINGLAFLWSSPKLVGFLLWGSVAAIAIWKVAPMFTRGKKK